MDLNLSIDQQMKHKITMTVLEKDIFNELRALAEGSSSRVDKDKPDDPEVGDNNPSLAFFAHVQTGSV